MNKDLINKGPRTVVADLNQIVESFECRWSTASDISQFLPDSSIENYNAIFCELVRVDLELRWQNGERKQIEEYLDRFPSVALSVEEKSQIAFEEYRLRNQYGLSCSAETFAQRLGVDISHWRTMNGRITNASATVSKNGLRSGIRFPEVGENFHEFELVALLGQGAFGRVYLARQSDLANRFIVVKITEICDIEPQTLARLQHTNIVPIHSLRRDNKLQSICMPFLGLVTLRDLNRQTVDGEISSYTGRELISTVAGKRASTVVGHSTNDGTDPAEIESALRVGDDNLMPAIAGLNYNDMILWMFGRIADGLAYSHARGVIHGDVKPGNVLINDDGQPLLLDFHLASRRFSDDPSLVGGTLPYMSAIHLKSLSGAASVDESCDLFSVGVMLFEAVTGRLPFPDRGQHEFDISEMIHDRMQPPKPVKELVPGISAGMSSIIEHCLSPQNHYQSADELSNDIARHLGDLPLKYAPNRSWSERVTKWARRHPRISSVSVVTSLMIVAVTLASILIGSRLSQAAKTEAVQQSHEFVQSLQLATQPLTLGRDHGIDLEKQSRVLADLLSGRTANRDDYAHTLAQLSDDVRETEKSAIIDSRYWLAWTLQRLSKMAEPGPKQQDFLQQASQEIEHVEKTTGSKPAAFVRLQADIYRQLGDTQKSNQLLTTVSHESEAAASRGLATELLRAAEFRRTNQEPQALKLLQRLAEEHPNDLSVWLMMGHSYLNLNQLADAEACYTVCIGLDNQSPWGFFSRGIARLQNREFAQAKLDFDRAIEINDSSTANLLNRALAYRGLNQPEQAIADLTEAIDRGCSETRALYIRCQLLRQTGQFEKAQADFETFLDLRPSDENSWLARGMAQIEMQRPELALADFQAALKLNPRSINAFQNIATVQAEYLGQTDAAIAALSEIIREKPENEIAVATRGVLYARIENREQALQDAQRALKLSQSADTRYRVAGIFGLTSKSRPQDADVAIDLLRKAALSNGNLVLSRMQQDNDLDRLRDNPTFRELVETLKSWETSPNTTRGERTRLRTN